MKSVFKKKEAFKFRGRKHSKKGIASLLTGIAVFTSFLILSIISSISRGNGDFILGLIAMGAFFLSFFGFILGYKSIKEKDIFFVAPIGGIFMNGVMFILYMSLYIVGVIS